jgi:hypothetical protein
MKEILEKIEELKKMGVSVNVLTSYHLQYGDVPNDFDMFFIHPDWGENYLKTELDKKLADMESRPWLLRLKRDQNMYKLCDNCVRYNFKYSTTMQSVETPIKLGICGKGHFNEINDKLIEVTNCNDYIKSNGVK